MALPVALGDIHEHAIDNVKAAITKDMTLLYPFYTQGFEICTDTFNL